MASFSTHEHSDLPLSCPGTPRAFAFTELTLQHDSELVQLTDYELMSSSLCVESLPIAAASNFDMRSPEWNASTPERIGHGSTAAVFLASNGDMSVADKRVRVANAAAAAREQAFMLRCEAHATLPGVVRTFAVTADGDDMHVVMQLMPRGSVASLAPLPGAAVVAIARDALIGLHTLHDVLRVVHRDLTPANLLRDDTGAVHIADFGVAAVLDEGVATATDYVGTLSHMAPERLRGEPHGAASDVWALGVTLLHLLLGHHPILRDAAKLSLDGKFWQLSEALRLQEAIPEQQAAIDGLVRRAAAECASAEGVADVIALAAACLQADAAARPTAHELLRHPAFAAVDRAVLRAL